jgi:hypothetical protein
MKIGERFARERRALFQRRPVTTANMKDEDTQTAAILSLDVQSRFVVRCMISPFSVRGISSPSEQIGKVSNLRGREKHLSRARHFRRRSARWLIKS